MSSTLAVGTLTPFASSVSSNAPSLPSVPPSDTSSPSGVNTVSLLTSPTPSISAPVITSAFSEQFQQPSSVLQPTMSAATVPTAAAPSSASPSEPSSTAPLTAAGVSPVSPSTPSAMIVTSSNDNQSMTSTSETSVQPTTLSTTTDPIPTQSPALTSSSLATTTPSMSTSSTSISTSLPTSNTPFTTTSSPLHSDSSSQSSFPAGAEMPLTTVLEGTTIFITSTNSQGQVMTSIPLVVTKVITMTGSGGIITTVTQAIVNPTLAPNNNTTGESSFFTDTGAVVGVFVVVGLASASIMMWILFAIRRRRRMNRIEQDTAVEAAVAAAGLNRAPLDDDDDDDSPISPNSRHQFLSGIDQRSSLFGLQDSGSLPTSARFSQVLDPTAKDSTNSHPVECRASNHPEGYVPTRTTSASPRADRCTDDLGSSRDQKSSYGHTPTYSAGSFEPLLANYVRNTPDQDTSALSMQPPRDHSPQHVGSGLVLNRYSSDGSHVDGSRISSKRQNSSDSSVHRDEEDYSRSVLMVRNVPDGQSQHSL